MCRLVAYHGAPLPLSTTVFGGSHSLYRQSWDPRELRTGSVNADGYGVSWLPGTGGELVRLARVGPIWHDVDLPGLLGSIRARSILAALRNATPGLPVGPAAVLPLVQGTRALVLNGFVPGFRSAHMRALREPLNDTWYGRLAGAGDAETLFFRTVQRVEEGVETGEALVQVAGAVRNRMEDDDYAPLTVVLQDPEGLTILHTAVNGAVNSLYLGESLPLAPDGVLLASEPLTADSDWAPVPHHSVVRIRDAGVSVEALQGF